MVRSVALSKRLEPWGNLRAAKTSRPHPLRRPEEGLLRIRAEGFPVHPIALVSSLTALDFRKCLKISRREGIFGVSDCFAVRSWKRRQYLVPANDVECNMGADDLNDRGEAKAILPGAQPASPRPFLRPKSRSRSVAS